MFFTYDEFQSYVQTAVQRFTKNWLNVQQNEAVKAPPAPPVFIVAGPGTGKTTVLALRVLKHIFVDEYSPNTIMATTFTKKAASELRSRILSWGVATQQEALKQAEKHGNIEKLKWLKSLDINQVKTGTLDSLAEEMIADDRQPGEITPTVIEGFMAKGLLRKNVMFINGRYRDPILQTHLHHFNRQYPGVNSFSSKLKICHSFADRVLHDGVDINAYSKWGDGNKILAEIIDDYHDFLKTNQLMDFALLEQEMLNRLQIGRLQSTTQNIRALLVDEFQDTNYLQEQIYYLLCRNSGAALTVVGDDDQSIYRFRGATVEIFADFSNRIQTVLGTQWNPTRINLINNYRSSERIVAICNHFIAADTSFQEARVPDKQLCIASADWANIPNQNLPILGMFRTDLQNLANDICTLLNNIFRNNGTTINISNNQQLRLQCNPNGGDFGDAVLLAGKVQETKYNGDPRLPLLIRQQLAESGVEVFNPRGRDFATIPEVMQCLGIMLECIDPDGTLQTSITSIKPTTINTLNNWRNAGLQFAQSNPRPHLPETNSLQKFMDDWSNKNAPNMKVWPSEWPLLELLFTVISWFPLFQRTPEGQIYIETIARTIAEASQISTYRSAILFGSNYDDQSVKDAIREVFEPIAEGEVEVDEDIMPYVPRAVFPIMTIHQAKGLEFPLVLVDVGSDFRTNHHTQRRFRFPDSALDVHLTEDEIARHSAVGFARQKRSGVDRAFDDITRQYFVAKSRPQNILVFVGLTSQLRQRNPVPSVATGDLRNGGRTYHFIPARQWTPNLPANTIALI